MIEFESVTKRYRDGTTAVDDLSLTIPSGKITVLVGPSGCGKTTALRIVAGLEELTEGEVSIGGHVGGLVGGALCALAFSSFRRSPALATVSIAAVGALSVAVAMAQVA